MKYLPLYKEWMKDGKTPRCGLCLSLDWIDDLDLFRPNGRGYFSYWAGDDDREFTPLRQNIVLFLAAQNNEL